MKTPQAMFRYLTFYPAVILYNGLPRVDVHWRQFLWISFLCAVTGVHAAVEKIELISRGGSIFFPACGFPRQFRDVS
jgi:hypothetical protein